jgi:hypothetical protein
LNNRGRQYLENRKRKAAVYYRNYGSRFNDDYEIPYYAILNDYRWAFGGCKKKHCICHKYKECVDSIRKMREDIDEELAYIGW